MERSFISMEANVTAKDECQERLFEQDGSQSPVYGRIGRRFTGSPIFKDSFGLHIRARWREREQLWE